jgi:hypothetical protein
MFNLTVASWQTVMLIAQMHEWDILLYITKKLLVPGSRKMNFGQQPNMVQYYFSFPITSCILRSLINMVTWYKSNKLNINQVGASGKHGSWQLNFQVNEHVAAVASCM